MRRSGAASASMPDHVPVIWSAAAVADLEAIHAYIARNSPRYASVVAGRVLHHVNPLGEGLDLLVSFAPLLVVDEFACDRIDHAAQDWYEGQHRMLRASGVEPNGPADLDEWRERHPGLHPHVVLLAALRERYDERALEWVPYLSRWLGGPSSESLEQTLIDAALIAPIGYRWAGVAR